MTSKLHTTLETMTWGFGWRNLKSFFVWYLIASSLYSLFDINYYLENPAYLDPETNTMFILIVIIGNLLFYLITFTRLFIYFFFYLMTIGLMLSSEELMADAGPDIWNTVIQGYLPIVVATLFVHSSYFIHGILKPKLPRGYNKNVSEVISIDKIEPLSHTDLRRFWYCPHDSQPLSPNTTRVMQTPYFLLTRDNLDLGIRNAFAMKKIPEESFHQTKILADYFFKNTMNDEMNLVSVFCPECGKIFSAPRI